MPNNLQESYEMFKKAYAKLKEFIETDQGTAYTYGSVSGTGRLFFQK